MATSGFSVMGSSLVFDGVTVGEVESWDGGELAIDSEDILTCDSTNYYADVIAKALNAGQVTFTCIFQPNNTTGNWQQLKTKAEARAQGTLLLTYPNAAFFTGSALLTALGFPSSADAAGVQRFTAAFKRAGQHSYTGT